MLASFRAFAKTPAAKIGLIFPLLIAFGMIFNVSDFLHPRISDAVVEAGPRSIGEQEFKTAFDRIKANFERERNGGEPIPVEELVKAGMPQQVADQMATEQAFGAWLAKTGFKPSDKLLEKEIQNTKAFFNPTTGAFDKQTYLQMLAQNGMTEQRFMQVLSDEVAGAHFDAGMFAGLHAPVIYTASQAALQTEKRDATWFTFDQKATGEPAKPTDDQLKAFVTERGAKLPELRTMTLVLFAPRTVMDQVKVDPADVKKSYDFAKDALYTQAETRNFVQITAASQADAAAISQALKGGTDPQALAKSRNLKPIVYVNRPKSAVPDPAVGSAAFALKAGEISGPIQGAFGWSVVKVDAIAPGHVKSFDDVKGDIEGKLKEKAAEAKADEYAQKYQDMRDKGVSMDDAAKQLGLTTLHYPPITKDGMLVNGQPIRTPTGQAFTFPKSVLQALYSTPKGGQIDSPEETGGPSEYFALRVDDVAPAHMLAVDDTTRPQLTQAWMQNAMVKLLQTKADALLARLQKGESFEAVAASVGAKVQSRSDFGRITMPQQRDQFLQMMKEDPSAIILAQSAGQAAGKPFAVNCNPIGPCKAIVRVDAVHAPVAAVAASDVLRYQQVADRQLAQGLSAAVQTHAKTAMKSKVDKDRVLAAIGAQQEGQTPPAKGK